MQRSLTSRTTSSPLLPLSLALGAVLLTSCAATSPSLRSQEDKKSAHFTIQPVLSSTTLGEVELDTGISQGDLELERDRIELRFGFGPERARGKFFVFGESISFDPSVVFSGADDEIDVYGLGGGMIGAPRVGKTMGSYGNEVNFIVPYEWDLAVAYGDDDDLFPSEVGYVEARATVGFGIDWKELQPSVGLVGSYFTGSIDDDLLLRNGDLDGVNIGIYGGVRYAPPSTPLLLHARVMGGDVEGFEFGFGVQI